MHERCRCLTCRLLEVIDDTMDEAAQPSVRVYLTLTAIAQVAGLTLAGSDDDVTDTLTRAIIGTRDQTRRRIRQTGGLQ